MSKLIYFEEHFIEVLEAWIDLALTDIQDASIGVKQITIDTFKDNLLKYKELCIEEGKNMRDGEIFKIE